MRKTNVVIYHPDSKIGAEAKVETLKKSVL